MTEPTANTTQMSNGNTEQSNQKLQEPFSEQDLNNTQKIANKKLKNAGDQGKENVGEEQYQKQMEFQNEMNFKKQAYHDQMFEMNQIDFSQFDQQNQELDQVQLQLLQQQHQLQQQQLLWEQQQQQQFQQEQFQYQNFQDQQNHHHQQQQYMEPDLQQILQLDEQYDSEDEGIQDYKIGGYHTVHVGEVLLNRYVIVQKIGWGHFSTVWLAKDFKYDTYVALKIQKSASHYLEAAYDEVEILQRVAKKCQEKEWMDKLKEYHKDECKKYFTKNDCQVVQLFNSFVYKGPYGNHFCFVFEILGVNLLEIIKKYNYHGVPVRITKKIAKQCLIGLDFLHENCGVIHTDLKPENVLVQLTKDEIQEIVEHGQMANRKLFKERVKVVRDRLGLPLRDDEIEPTLEDLVQNPVAAKIEPGMSKNQRKNIKRKQKRKQKKKQEFLQKQIAGEDNYDDSQSVTQSEQRSELKGNDNSQTQQVDPKNLSVEELFSKTQGKQQGQNNPKLKVLEKNFNIKIADLGNACWTHHHFATEIQTRQYRSPEVIVEADYNPTADIWSLACMLFEMMTADFLFEPRKGPNFSKNEDHLAQMQELVGKFDPLFSTRGRKSQRYFDAHGNLKKIPQLHFWPLKNVLCEKYKFKEDFALQFQDFMLNMLHPQPECRSTAKQMLNHPWIWSEDKEEQDYRMTDDEHKNYLKKRETLQKLLQEEYQPINEDHFVKKTGNFGNPSKFDYIEVDGDNEDNSEFSDEDDEDDEDNEESDGNQEEQKDEQYKQKQQNEKKINKKKQKKSEDSFELYNADPSFTDVKVVDRSFTKYGYIGYGDGIDLAALDNTGNWQFDNL